MAIYSQVRQDYSENDLKKVKSEKVYVKQKNSEFFFFFYSEFGIIITGEENDRTKNGRVN